MSRRSNRGRGQPQPPPPPPPQPQQINFLDFSQEPNRSAFERKFQEIRLKPLEPGKYVDWLIFNNEGVGDDDTTYLKSYLDVPVVINGETLFTVSVWRDLFGMEETQYRELILEFFSTYKFTAPTENFANTISIEFRLGGQMRQLSLLDFATALNLYPPEIRSHPYYITLIESGERSINEQELFRFWEQIVGPNPFRPGKSKASNIRDPFLLMFHRLITKSINNRKEGDDKVNKTDLNYLYLIAHRRHVNIPWGIARYLNTAIGQKPESAITGGQFITRLARFYGLLDDTTQFTELPCMKLMDVKYWKSINVITRIGSNRFRFLPRHNWRNVVSVALMDVDQGEGLPQNEEEYNYKDDDDEDYTGAGEGSSGARYDELLGRVTSLENNFQDFRAEARGHMHAHNQQMEWLSQGMQHMWHEFGYTPGPFPPSYYHPPPSQ